MLKAFEEMVREAREAATPLAARTIWSASSPQLEQHSDGLVRVALCGTFTTQPLEPYLGMELLCHEMAASIHHAPYNQIHSELLSPTSTLRSDPVPEVVVVLWRMEELLSAALALLTTDPGSAREAAKRKPNGFLQGLKVFLDAPDPGVIGCNPMRPDVRPLGLLDAVLDQ